MIWKKKLVFNGLWVSVAKKQRQSILLQQMNDGEGRSIQEDDIPALLYLCVNISDLKFHMVAGNFREQQSEVEAMRKEGDIVGFKMWCNTVFGWEL
jgi:hypothetical protein